MNKTIKRADGTVMECRPVGEFTYALFLDGQPFDLNAKLQEDMNAGLLKR